MDFRTQWNVYQMKVEDLGLHFLLVIWMDIHYALQILRSKSLFWFLVTSVFFAIQTCVDLLESVQKCHFQIQTKEMQDHVW